MTLKQLMENVWKYGRISDPDKTVMWCRAKLFCYVKEVKE